MKTEDNTPPPRTRECGRREGRGAGNIERDFVVTDPVRGLIGTLLALAACSAQSPESPPDGTRARVAEAPLHAAPERRIAPGARDVPQPTLATPSPHTSAGAPASPSPSPQRDPPGSTSPSEGDRSGSTSPLAPTPGPANAPPPPTSAARLDALALALRALDPDPAPEHTTNDKHYLVSNERRHDLFRPELDDKGGVLLGVGSDQSYVMAPWAGTELLVIVDFDEKVVDLHSVHGALMGAAPTVEEFRRLWSPEGVPDAHAVLADAFEEPTRTQRLELYDQAREWVDKRLRRLAARYEELGVHSYLDTPQQYRFVTALHARGRVVALRGDFTREGVLRRVADTLRAHGQPVKVLYLSNIEQYFAYRKPFKQNMQALPFDDTLVLRTLPGRPAGFHYILQSGEDFLAWMRAPKVWSVYRIRGFVKGEPLDAHQRFVAGPPPDDREG